MQKRWHAEIQGGGDGLFREKGGAEIEGNSAIPYREVCDFQKMWWDARVSREG